MGNLMGVRTPTDFNAIRAETEAKNLENREKEYGLMSGLTQRGMAADVAGKEKDIAYKQSLMDEIQYALEDKRATETERRAAEKVENLVKSVTGKSFLEVAQDNPEGLKRFTYAAMIGDKDTETAEKAHKAASELGMNVAEAFKVSPAYAGQLLEQGTKRIKDVYGVDTASMFGGVDFSSPEADQMLQAWTAGHMDVNKLIEHRFKLEEQTQKAVYDIGLKQFESGLNKEEETHKASLKQMDSLNADEHMLPNGSKATTSELRQIYKQKFNIMGEDDFKIFSIINKDNPSLVEKERKKIDDAPDFIDWSRTEYGIDIFGKMPVIKPTGTFEELPDPSEHIGAKIQDNKTGKTLTPKKVNGVWKWVPE